MPFRIYEPAEPWGCRDRGQGSEKESVGEAAEAAGQAGGPVTSTELYKFRKWFDGNSALASRTACQRCEIARSAAVWHATCHVTRSPEVKMHASRATVYVGCHAPRHPLLSCLGSAQPAGTPPAVEPHAVIRAAPTGPPRRRCGVARTIMSCGIPFPDGIPCRMGPRACLV